MGGKIQVLECSLGFQPNSALSKTCEKDMDCVWLLPLGMTPINVPLC